MVLHFDGIFISRMDSEKMIKKVYSKLLQMPDNKIALLLFVFSFALRFPYSVYAYSNNIMGHFADDNFYYQFANQVIAQGVLFSDTSFSEMADYLGPGLPWINALTIYIFGNGWVPIFFVTTLVSALITFFTFKVAIKVTNKPAALLAGLWSCCYLFYFKFSPTAGKDIWLSFFMILIIYFLITLFVERNFTYLKLVFFSFIYAYSFHFDERFFMLAPFIFIYIAVIESINFQKFKIFHSLAFAIIVFFLTIPWCIRNYIHHDKIVLISSRTEYLTDKFFGYESRPHPTMYNITDVHGKYYIPDYQIDSVISGEIDVTSGGKRISEYQRAAMRRGNIPKPLTDLEKYWLNARILLRPFQINCGEYHVQGYRFYRQSMKHRLASFLFYGLMFIFSFPGFFLFYKENKKMFCLFLSFVMIYTLIHTFFVPWTTWRYRLPLDAIFIIVGSYGIISISTLFRNRSKVL